MAAETVADAVHIAGGVSRYAGHGCPARCPPTTSGATTWPQFLESRYRRQQAVVHSRLPNPVRHQAEEHAAIVAAIEARDDAGHVQLPRIASRAARAQMACWRVVTLWARLRSHWSGGRGDGHSEDPASRCLLPRRCVVADA